MANVWDSTAATLPKHEVDPISRIEGHLGVKVATNDSGVIVDANAHGNLWRGFENFLLGRDINDAITFVQRICGVCPVPHGLTSTYAVDAALGYSKGHITFAEDAEADGTWGVPTKAVLIRNLVAASDTMMSTITHFYHLAAPSYIQGPAMPPWMPFFDNNYYHPLLLNPGGGTFVPRLDEVHLWDAVILSYVRALKYRRMVFEAGSLFAGRMPMTSCFTGGGVTNDHTENLTDRIERFRSLMTEVGAFVVNEYVPIALALGALYPDFDSQENGLGSLSGCPRGFGAGLGRFLSWGAYPDTTSAGTLAQAGGVWDATVAAGATEDPLHFKVSNKADVYNKFLAGALSVPTNLTEDIAHSRYMVDKLDLAAYKGTTTAYPGDVSRTHPKRSEGYTYIKAPRWAGKPCEVGPFARLVVAGIYPVKGTTLTTIPGYKELYTVNGNGTGGLNVPIIGTEIVAGLDADKLLGGTGSVADVPAFILGLNGGLSTLDRLRARALEALVLVQAILGTASFYSAGANPAARVKFAGNGWLDALLAIANDPNSGTWRSIAFPTGESRGWGAHEAARGALMHQATIKAGKITKYQCIVPTTWNASPKDSAKDAEGIPTPQRGAMEEAMIGATFFLEAGTGTSKGGAKFDSQDGVAVGANAITTEGGVEVLRIAQSFDPCIACAIH